MFTVVWAQNALNGLTRIWAHADSDLRRAVTSAAKEIDQILENDPESIGESRTAQERIFFLFPLGLRFEVDRENSRVRVLQVWSYRKRK